MVSMLLDCWLVVTGVLERTKKYILTLRLSPVCLPTLFVTITALADATSELSDVSRDDVTHECLIFTGWRLQRTEEYRTYATRDMPQLHTSVLF